MTSVKIVLIVIVDVGDKYLFTGLTNVVLRCILRRREHKLSRHVMKRYLQQSKTVLNVYECLPVYVVIGVLEYVPTRP